MYTTFCSIYFKESEKIGCALKIKNLPEIPIQEPKDMKNLPGISIQ